MKTRRLHANWPTKPNSWLTRLFAFFLSGILSITHAAVADVSGLAYGFSKPIHILSNLKQSDIYSFGKIEKIFKGKSDKTIVVIQDAHANFEAQKNIAHLIDYLSQKHNLTLINLEGSAGKLKHQLLALYPDKQARLSVARHFLREAKLTGPEFLAITKRPELMLFGAETKELYAINRNAFLNILASREGAQATLTQLESLFKKLTTHVYSEKLREIKERRDDFRASSDYFGQYLAFLVHTAKEVGIGVQKYVQIRKFLELIESDERMVREDTKSRVAGMAQELGITSEIFSETAALESETKNHLFRNGTERQMDTFSRALEVMDDMLSLSITKQDIYFIRDHREDFQMRRMISFLESLLDRYHFELSGPENWQRLENDLRKVEEFYELAMTRDLAIIQNALRQMKNEKQTISVLVAGGFHTSGIEDYLKEHRHSYLVISPHIKDALDEDRQRARYEASIMQIPLLDGGTLARSRQPEIFDPQHQMAAVSLLLDEEGGKQLLTRKGISELDLLGIIREDAQLGFNIVFTLLLQLEDLIQDGQRTERYLQKIARKLSPEDRRLMPLLYERFIPTDVKVIPGENPDEKHILGKQITNSHRFMVTVTKSSDRVRINDHGMIFNLNEHAYRFTLEDESKSPSPRRISHRFEDLMPLVHGPETLFETSISRTKHPFSSFLKNETYQNLWGNMVVNKHDSVKQAISTLAWMLAVFALEGFDLLKSQAKSSGHSTPQLMRALDEYKRLLQVQRNLTQGFHAESRTLENITNNLLEELMGFAGMPLQITAGLKEDIYDILFGSNGVGRHLSSDEIKRLTVLKPILSELIRTRSELRRTPDSQEDEKLERIPAETSRRVNSEMRIPNYRDFIQDAWLIEAHSPHPSAQLEAVRQKIYDGAIRFFNALREGDHLRHVREALLSDQTAQGQVFRKLVDSPTFEWRIMTKGSRPEFKVGPAAGDYFSFVDHHEWMYQSFMDFVRFNFASFLDRFYLPVYPISWVHRYFSRWIGAVAKIPTLRNFIPTIYGGLIHPWSEHFTLPVFGKYPNIEAAANVVGLAALEIEVFEKLSQKDQRLFELAMAIHDLGRVVTMGTRHPALGGELSPYLIDAINSSTRVISEEDKRLLVALTAHELDFGTIPFGEGSPRYLRRILEQRGVDVRRFIKFMTLIYLFDAASVAKAKQYPDDFIERDGQLVPKKGSLSYKALKAAVVLSKLSNLDQLQQIWPEKRISSIYEPVDVTNLTTPWQQSPHQAPAVTHELLAQDVRFREFWNATSMRGMIFGFRYLAKKSPLEVIKWFYLISTLYDPERLDSFGFEKNHAEALDIMIPYLRKLPDPRQMMQQGWHFRIGSDNRLDLIDGQTGQDLATLEYVYDQAHKEIEIFVGTWHEVVRSEMRNPPVPVEVSMNVDLYNKYLRPHFQKRGGRPLPDIMRELSDQGILFQIFPFMQTLASPEHTQQQGVNVFDQMLLSVRFLWEMETGADGPEFERIFQRVAPSLRSRELIYLVALLFDTGKLGPPSGHEERGAQLLEPIFRQLSFTPNQIDRALWVIAHHGFLGEFFFFETLPTALFDALRSVRPQDQNLDLSMLVLINAADTHAWKRQKTPYTIKAANQYARYLEPGYFDQLDMVEQRLRSFSSERTENDLVLIPAKLEEVNRELTRVRDLIGEHQFESFLENLRSQIRRFDYGIPIFHPLTGQALARLLFLISQMVDSAGPQIQRISFSTPSRLAGPTVEILSNRVLSIPDEFIFHAHQLPFAELQTRLQNQFGIPTILDISAQRIIIDNAQFLTPQAEGPQNSSELRVAMSDHDYDRLQAEYESARDDHSQGGFFGKPEQGPYFGWYKENYMLKRAHTDPRFYFDAIAVYVPKEDASEAVHQLKSAKGKSIPRYTFIFRTDEPLDEVSERLQREQRSFPDIRLVPVGVVTGEVPGTMSGALWARKTVRDYLEQLGYSWETLKLKALLLAFGSGGRVFPQGKHNKILASSPIANESYLTQNLRNILQYIIPQMKRSTEPAHNFVIYPDSRKFLDRELEIQSRGRTPFHHDFEFIGSLIRWDDQSLTELGVANIDENNRLISFVEKPENSREIEIRLGLSGGPLKFQSFGDLWGTDQFFDALERQLWDFFMTSTGQIRKVPLDFAMHLGEPATLFMPSSQGGMGMSVDDWQHKKIDKIQNPALKAKILTAIKDVIHKNAFVLGVARGETQAEFIHSNSLEANYEMSARLVRDPFLRLIAGIGSQDIQGGRVIGPNVYLGSDVVVEPGAVILGHTIIRHGRVQAGAVIKDSWVDTLLAEGGSMIHRVDARHESIIVPQGYFANDVFVGTKDSARYVRRLREDINAPIHLAAVVVTTGSLRNEQGNIDPEAIKSLERILQKPNGPVIALASHYDFQMIYDDIIRLIHPALRRQIIVYGENGASATGFDHQGNPLPTFYRYAFANKPALKKRIRRIFRQFAPGRFQLHQDLPAFLSHSFQRQSELKKAAAALRRMIRDHYIYIFQNQVRISLSDRRTLIDDLMIRLRVEARPNQKILIIGSEGGVVRLDSQHAIPAIDTTMLELSRADNYSGRVYSITTQPFVDGLSLAIERSKGNTRSAATIHALEEVRRTMTQVVHQRRWKITENRASMQDLQLGYDRKSAGQFDRERKRHITQLKKAKSEMRQIESVRFDTLAQHLEFTAQQRLDRILRKLRPEANANDQERFETEYHAVSLINRWLGKIHSHVPIHSVNKPSFIVTDWNPEQLSVPDIAAKMNGLPHHSTLILLLSEDERPQLEQEINETLTAIGNKRILLAVGSAEKVVERLLHLKQAFLDASNVYQLRMGPDLLRDSYAYRLLWRGSSGLIEPGRIVVFTREEFNIQGAHDVPIDRSSLANILESLYMEDLAQERSLQAA